MPIYYGNVCLRLIPVLDILIHRLIEMTPGKSRFRFFSINDLAVKSFDSVLKPLIHIICRNSSFVGKYPGYCRIVVQISRKTGDLFVQHSSLLRQKIEEVNCTFETIFETMATAIVIPDFLLH